MALSIATALAYDNVMARKADESALAAPTRKQEKQDTRRREIVAACRTLFFETSYDNVSIRDIEKATGLTRGAIYYYFRGKEDIYCAVVVEGVQRVRQLLMDAADPYAGDPRAQLVALLTAMSNHYLEERPVFDNLLRFFFGMRPTVLLSDELLRDTEAEVRTTVDAMVAIIEAGNEMGVFACEDPEFAVMVFWSLYATTIQMAPGNDRLRAVARPWDKLVQDLEAHMLHTVGARE